jgi:hypothetical protein
MIVLLLALLLSFTLFAETNCAIFLSKNYPNFIQFKNSVDRDDHQELIAEITAWLEEEGTLGKDHFLISRSLGDIEDLREILKQATKTETVRDSELRNLSTKLYERGLEQANFKKNNDPLIKSSDAKEIQTMIAALNNEKGFLHHERRFNRVTMNHDFSQTNMEEKLDKALDFYQTYGPLLTRKDLTDLVLAVSNSIRFSEDGSSNASRLRHLVRNIYQNIMLIDVYTLDLKSTRELTKKLEELKSPERKLAFLELIFKTHRYHASSIFTELKRQLNALEPTEEKLSKTNAAIMFAKRKNQLLEQLQ